MKKSLHLHQSGWFVAACASNASQPALNISAAEHGRPVDYRVAGLLITSKRFLCDTQNHDISPN